jgi:hypothetical protein
MNQIMRSLEIERFLDFGIWSNEEMDEDNGREGEGKEEICQAKLVLNITKRARSWKYRGPPL